MALHMLLTVGYPCCLLLCQINLVIVYLVVFSLEFSLTGYQSKMLRRIQSMPWNRYITKCCPLGVQRYSTTTINTVDADKWITSLDDENRAKITQLQAIVS